MALCSTCRMIDLSPDTFPLLTQNSRSTDRERRSILSRHPDCRTETARSGNLPINKYTVTLTVLYVDQSYFLENRILILKFVFVNITCLLLIQLALVSKWTWVSKSVIQRHSVKKSQFKLTIVNSPHF